MTADDGKHVASLVVAAIKTALTPGYTRLKELERRVAELEQRPQLKYMGTWDTATQYNNGDVTTDGGSAWFCKASTRTRPGSSNDWQLMVKRGRDAR